MSDTESSAGSPGAADVTTRSADVDPLFASHVPLIGLVADAEGIRIDGCNPAFEQLSGKPVSELKGKSWDGLLFGATASAQGERIADEISQGKSGHADGLFRTDTEHATWFRFSWNPLPREKNGVLRVAGAFTDISDLMRSLSSERTKRRVADIKTRAKSDFFAMMSHEIRTPMNSIIGFTDLLAGTELSEEQSECLEMIENNSRGLITVLNDILDYSKTESGRLKLDAHPFNLRGLVTDTIRQIEPKAAAKGLDLRLTIAPELPDQVTADAQRLRQILLNLLTNAEKFTETGHIHLLVEQAEKSDGALLRLAFTIQDTGIGIPENSIAALFEEFTQVDYSATRLYGGTGLGLVVAQRLCRLMGGHITVKSESGSGAVFRFDIAAAGSESSDATTIVPLTSVNLTRKAERSESGACSVSVLIAEDNHANLKVLQHMLKSFSLESDSASDGEEAINAVLKRHYDLILLDLQMPKYDGLSVARRVRLLERSPAALRSPGSPHADSKRSVIIAVTANTLTHTREDCLAVGMDDYLSKPIRRKVFAETLGRYFPEIVQE